MAYFTYADIAKMIDHSLLQPVLTDADLEQGCRLAREYEVASICIKPYFVRQSAELLAGSTVATCRANPRATVSRWRHVCGCACTGIRAQASASSVVILCASARSQNSTNPSSSRPSWGIVNPSRRRIRR